MRSSERSRSSAKRDVFLTSHFGALQSASKLEPFYPQSGLFCTLPTAGKKKLDTYFCQWESWVRRTPDKQEIRLHRSRGRLKSPTASIRFLSGTRFGMTNSAMWANVTHFHSGACLIFMFRCLCTDPVSLQGRHSLASTVILLICERLPYTASQSQWPQTASQSWCVLEANTDPQHQRWAERLMKWYQTQKPSQIPPN